MASSSPARVEEKKWHDELVLALSPTMSQLNFRRTSKDTYKRKHSNRTDIYSVSIRFLRTTSGPRAKLSAAIAVDFPELKELEWRLRPEPRGQKLPPVGGTIGLYTDAGRYVEWPVVDLDSTLALRQQFEQDINNAAVPFWDLFPSIAALLEALEAEHPWTSVQRRRDSLRIAALLVVRGVDAALSFVDQHPERYHRHGGVSGVGRRIEEVLQKSGESGGHP